MLISVYSAIAGGIAYLYTCLTGWYCDACGSRLHTIGAAEAPGQIFICLPPGTIIAGDYKPIEQHAEGDQIVGLSGHTDVRAVMAREYDGDLLEIKATGLLPIKVTPEHPFLVVSRHFMRPANQYLQIFSDPHWKPARNIVVAKAAKEGDCLLIPRIVGTDESKSISLGPFQTHKGWKITASKAHNKDRPLITDFPVNNGTAWLLGLYVAEGFTGAKHGAVVISLAKQETYLQNRAVQILREIGYQTQIAETRTTTNIIVCSSALANAIEAWCGHGAENKRIPQFILYHKDVGVLGNFISGYWAGDGSKSRCGRPCQAATVSQVLALQIQLAMARLGIVLRVCAKRTPTEAVIEGRKVQQRQTYFMTYYPHQTKKYTFSKVTDDFIVAPVRKITTANYKGLVHNLQTGDETYLANNAIVHNCLQNDCRRIYKMHVNEKGKKQLQLIRCLRCLEPVQHSNKAGDWRLTCARDGQPFFFSLGNPAIVFRALPKSDAASEDLNSQQPNLEAQSGLRGN